MTTPRSNAVPLVPTQEIQQTSAILGQIISGLKNKTLEKWLLYGVGLVGATNGFSFIHMNTGLREVLVGSAAGVLSFIHMSTPVVK